MTKKRLSVRYFADLYGQICDEEIDPDHIITKVDANIVKTFTANQREKLGLSINYLVSRDVIRREGYEKQIESLKEEIEALKNDKKRIAESLIFPE
jgi:hypothetical protein